MDDYSEILMEHFSNPRNKSPMPDADLIGHAGTPGRGPFFIRKTRCCVVAFGPEIPGWGSWDWVGSDLADTLADDFDTRTFRAWEEPEADVVILIKHAAEAGLGRAALPAFGTALRPGRLLRRGRRDRRRRLDAPAL